MAIPNFDFSDQGSASKALKKISQLMLRAGQPVVSSSFDTKMKRTSGVSYREALMTLASGQTVTLRVTQTGDIFQVLLNNSVKPIHQQSDPNKAVAEIAKLADSNQAAFQKAQARVKVELPKGIKTAAPRMEVALQARVADLDTQIAERQTQVNELKAELGEALVLDAASPADVIAWHDGNSYTRDQFDMVPTDEHGEMPPSLCLKAGAVPVAPILDDAKGGESDFAAAVALAESVLSGTVLDSVDAGHAIATLRIALETVETNYPINIEAGNIEQAQLEAECAESFRNAIAALDSAANQDVGDNPPKLDEPVTPQPSHAADAAVAADATLQYPPEPVTDAVPPAEVAEKVEGAGPQGVEEPAEAQA